MVGTPAANSTAHDPVWPEGVSFFDPHKGTVWTTPAETDVGSLAGFLVCLLLNLHSCGELVSLTPSVLELWFVLLLT